MLITIAGFTVYDWQYAAINAEIKRQTSAACARGKVIDICDIRDFMVSELRAYAREIISGV